MKVILSAVVIFAALFSVDASAQSANLSGRWQCMALCLGSPGGYAFITQNGWDLNESMDRLSGPYLASKSQPRRNFFARRVHASIRPRNDLAAGS
jgi:hypothetical protein